MAIYLRQNEYLRQYNNTRVKPEETFRKNT